MLLALTISPSPDRHPLPLEITQPGTRKSADKSGRPSLDHGDPAPTVTAI